jgi:peptide/nickel transport system substrate-binding protein
MSIKHKLGFIAALILAVAGFGVVFAQGNILRVAAIASPPTLDPHASTTRATADIGINVFESLVGYGEDFSPQPQIAHSWDISDDGLIYTFYIHEGILFHNGRELTAADIKASLDRVLEMGVYRARFSDVETVEVVDDYTIRITLSQPNAPLLINLAEPSIAIMPSEAIEGRSLTNAELIGTGPFRFVEWLPDRHVRLERFEDYVPRDGESTGNIGQRAALVDEVLFIPVPEESARAAGLETGEYHIADFLPYGAGRRLMQSPDVVILEVEQHMKPFVYINHHEDRPTADLDLRRAIQAALNHEEIMAVASEGYGSLHPSIGFRVWSSDAGAEYYDIRDTDAARAHMEAAGYDGTPLVLVTNTDYDVMYRSALMIQRQLELVGFEIDLQVFDWPGSRALRDTLQWDLFISGHLLQEDPSVIEFHFQPDTSPFAYDDPHVSSLLSQGRAETDFDRRFAIYEELQEYVYENAAWIKLFDQNIFQGTGANVEGYRPWPYMRVFNVSVNGN